MGVVVVYYAILFIHQNPIHRTQDGAHHILSWDLMCGTKKLYVEVLGLERYSGKSIVSRIASRRSWQQISIEEKGWRGGVGATRSWSESQAAFCR